MALFSIPLIFEIIFFGNRPSANGRFFPSRQVIFSPREYQHTLRSKLIFNTRQHVKKVHRRCANLLVRSICKLERDERRVSTIQRTTMQNRRIKGRRRISVIIYPSIGKGRRKKIHLPAFTFLD